MEKKIRYCFLLLAFIFSISVSSESNAQSEVINNMRTGKIFRAGSLDVDVLKASFGL